MVGLCNTAIESQIKESLGEEKFNALKMKVGNELGDEQSHVLKNIEGASLFIQYSYLEGSKIPILEDIVNKITKMYEIQKFFKKD